MSERVKNYRGWTLKDLSRAAPNDKVLDVAVSSDPDIHSVFYMQSGKVVEMHNTEPFARLRPEMGKPGTDCGHTGKHAHFIVKNQEASTFVKSFTEMQSRCHTAAVAKGFWDEPAGGIEKIALMHSELSEALEAMRAGNPQDKHCPEFSSLEVELADVLIRVLDFGGYYKLKIAEALEAKLKFNESRPYKHGKKF